MITISGGGQVLHVVLLQQLLQVLGFLVPQVEQTVPGMVGVKTELGAARLLATL